MAGGQVGALRVLMGADWAQLQADMGKAKQVVSESRAEFALFGRAGKDAQRVLIDIGSESQKGGASARQLGSLLATSLGGFNREGAAAVKLLSEGIGGGIGKAALAAGAAMAAVGFAVDRIQAAYQEMKAAEEAYAKGSKERLSKALEEQAEAIDRKLGGGWARVATLAKEAEQAERRAAEARKAFADSGWWEGRGSASAKAAMDKAENEAEAARQRVGEAELRRSEEARKRAEDFGKTLRRLAEDDALALAMAGLAPPIRKAEEAAVALRRQLREAAVEGGLEGAADRLFEQYRRGNIALDTYVAKQKEIREAEEAVNEAVKRRQDLIQHGEIMALGKSYRERIDALKEQHALIVSGAEASAGLAATHAKIAAKEKERAAATGETRRVLGMEIGALSQIAAWQERIAAATREATGLEKARAMAIENDAAAIAGRVGATDREKALAENDAARRKALEGLAEGSDAALALTEEFRIREADINARYDRQAIEAHLDFLSRVDSIRRAARAQTLTDDRNQTRLRLDEEDARHDAELQAVNQAQIRGDLSEEQAGARRASLTASHIEFRLAIIRAGKEQELAWEASYAGRILDLQAEGETDRARVVRLGMDRRILALREETRQVADELERRGESQRAADVRAEAAAAEDRIRRQAAIQEALVGEDLGAGARARVSQLREETAGWGQLGAQLTNVVTNNLSGGVVNALEEVIRGTKDSKEAFRDWGAGFAFEVARMIEQALLMKAILALLPGLSGGAAAPTSAPVAVPAAATGGSFRVGGYGGLDSQLLLLRATPGEMVRVSSGEAAGGGGGGVNLQAFFNIRPPGIFADRLPEKMSREAKAGLVSSTVRRGGQRAPRAVD